MGGGALDDPAGERAAPAPPGERDLRGRFKNRIMMLLPIAFFATIALASWLLRNSRFAMAGFLLQIALAIFVLLYLKARPE